MTHRPGIQTIRSAATLALLLALAAPAHAESADEIARQLRVNQQALQDFSWKSRAEVQVNGKTKDVQLFEMRYDMDGGLLETQLEVSEAGRQRKTSRHEVGTDLKDAIEAYTHLSPVTLKKMFAGARIQPGEGDDAGLVRVQADSVKSLGDRVDLWVDRATKRPRRSEIVTTVDGKAVRIVTEFAELDGGPTYPARTKVHTEIRSKPAILSIENFDFALQGG